MPKRTSIKIDDVPYQYKNRKLQIGKSYTSPDFRSNTVLTDDIFTLKFEIDSTLFGVAPASISSVYANSISSKFKVSDDDKFVLQSVNGSKRNNQDSLSTDFKNANDELRREFQYIRSNKKLWYLKRTALNSPNVMNLNSMLIIIN